MKPFAFAVLFFCMGMIISCKKEKDADEITTEAKLLGKWNLESFTSYVGGQLYTNNYSPGLYLLFESGGKLTTNVDNRISYSTWELLDQGKTLFIQDNGVLDVPPNGFQVKTLTDTSLELYAEEANTPPQQGTTIRLKK